MLHYILRYSSTPRKFLYINPVKFVTAPSRVLGEGIMYSRKHLFIKNPKAGLNDLMRAPFPVTSNTQKFPQFGKIYLEKLYKSHPST